MRAAPATRVPLRDLPEFDRPRERLIRAGPDLLTDIELLAILVGAGTRGIDVETVASAILGRFADLPRLAAAGVAELATVPGLGLVKACRLKAALALAGRLAERPFNRGEPVLHPGAVWDRVGRRLAQMDHEVFIALALDGQARVITELSLAHGGACSVDFRPADVFRALLRAGATSTILVHNHPSGDPEPSQNDLRATRRMHDAGQLLGVFVLDHVIVARGGYRSCLAGKEEDRPKSE
jgi:DNA repair protein RadC